MSPKMKVKYLKQQKQYVKKLKDEDGAGFGFVSLGELVQSLRSAKYKDTSKALFELIDNSIEAQAGRIIIAVKTVAAEMKNKRAHIGEIAIIDTGYGMEPAMIRAGLKYGGTHRYNQRNGIGRFGMGFPTACGSMTPTYSVFSKLEDESMFAVHVNLQDVVEASFNGEDVDVPTAVKATLPNWIGNIKFTNSDGEDVDVHSLNHCTAVQIKNPDKLSAGYYLANHFINNMQKECGITYRDFLIDNKISLIEHVEKENKYGEMKETFPVDPLFIREDALFYSVKENDKHAQARKGGILEINDIRGKTRHVTVRYSYLPAGFRQKKGSYKGNTVGARSKIMNRHRGVMILKRNGRQMSVVSSMYFPNANNNTVLNNNDVNWLIEVDFPATLDEVFNVSHDKQGATPSPLVWEHFEKFGMPTFISESRLQYREEAQSRKDRLQKDDTPDIVESVIEAIKEVDATPILSEELENAIEEEKEKQVQATLKKMGIDRKKPQDDKEKEEVERITAEIRNEVEVKGINYNFSEASRREGPFYWADLDGVKVTIKLNTAHQFYQEFYADAIKETKDCIRILLYSLVLSDVTSTLDNRRWYARQRGKWSHTLGLALDNYVNNNPIDKPIEFEPPVSLEDDSELTEVA
jgi:hypothetical protein